MLKLQQIGKHFQHTSSPDKKQQFEYILKKLKDETIVLENPIVSQLLTCLNQLQLLLSLQLNELLKIINKQGSVFKFKIEIEWFEQIIQDQNELEIMKEKLSYLENLEIKIQNNGSKIFQLNINKKIVEKIHQVVSVPSLDELYVIYLRNQETLIQTIIKLFCIVSIIQEEFNKILYGMVSEKEQSIKERIILTNLDLIYKTPQYLQPNIEVKTVNYQYYQNKLLIYQQAENNLITKAFELLDNTMYGKRKRSFEKDKESAYQNYSQRTQPEMPMDIFRIDPYMSYQAQAILSQVAPPCQSPVLTHVSTFPKPNSLCLSPSNSDSHSFTSQKNKGFNYNFGHLHSQYIDQNQYAQISQQNIDAQIRQRKMLINQQQNQRVSRSKSNSTIIMDDIFKQICLDNKIDEKTEEKQKQKGPKKTLIINQNQKKQQSKVNK